MCDNTELLLNPIKYAFIVVILQVEIIHNFFMKPVYTAVIGLLVFGAVVSTSSCLKKDHDAPEDTSGYDPKLTVTHTIAQLQALPAGTIITEDIIIEGIVCINDQSGNYYKKFALQDATGGIEVLVEENNMYNKYPVGRKLYLRCKGLYIGAYGLNPQLGYTPNPSTGALSSIPTTLVDDYIIKANYPNTLQVDTLTIDQLASPNAAKQYLNKLVAIKDVEFASGSAGVPYAQLASLASATNQTIKDCGTGTIVLRTSGYAKFQPYTTPTGKGIITAVYTRFNNTPQLYIRDTTDVHFTGSRCDGSSSADVTLLTEDFNSASSGVVALTGWLNIAEAGTQQYVFSGNASNPYAKISAYNTGQSSVKSWLITPNVNLSGLTSAKLTVRTTYGFAQAETLKAFVSNNFTGNDPSTATWTELSSIVTAGQANWSWKDQTVDLSAYVGQNIKIAFVYDGGDPGKTGTYEIDDVKIIGKN
jgi:hypothetical protein